MALRLPEERVAKIFTETVRHGVEQSVDELPRTRFAHSNLEVAVFATELVSGRHERMRLAAGAARESLGTVAASGQNRVSLDVLAQMTEQIDGAVVSPVDVFQHEQQRTVAREALEKLGALFEHDALLDACAWVPGLSSLG